MSTYSNAVAYFFFVFYYLYYTHMGDRYTLYLNIRWAGLVIFADLLFNVTNCLLVLFLILLAKGYGLYFRKISRQVLIWAIARGE